MSTQHRSAVTLSGPNVHDGQVNVAEFERFLGWLGPDPESAGRKYELIRGRLIMMFRARRCPFAEDLADTTFERVARKLADLTAEFTGDPARYFYGVAKKVYLEYQRDIMNKRRRDRYSLPTTTEDQDLENLLKQLDDALSAIPKSDRELILTYYTDSGRNKINHRRALAEQFGIELNALRLRVFRIRREIKNYMLRPVQMRPLGGTQTNGKPWLCTADRMKP
jgi:DNA-directed RNA polymerase specialized sigma24 family protein